MHTLALTAKVDIAQEMRRMWVVGAASISECDAPTYLENDMAKNAKQDKQVPATQTPIAIALATLFPLFSALQNRTSENVTLGASRSAGIVAAIKTLHATSTDYAADCVALLGDGKKGTKKEDHAKGTLADALSAKFGDKLHVSVRNETAWARIVASNWNIPAVREAAEKSGLRKARDVAKPKATPEATPEATPVSAQFAKDTALAWIHAHLDEALEAVRGDLLRAADSIGVSKLAELEIHLNSKTRKQA